MMKLIDAELLIDHLSGHLKLMEDYDAVRKLVKEMPAVYDVDKVVAQLEKLKHHEVECPDNYSGEDGWADCEEAYEDGESNGRYSAYGKAIKIVRKGGV